MQGSDKAEYKAEQMMKFSSGELRVLISKPKICGFGMNWQHCARMAFVGLDDSFEKFYQAVRRCYRFGQKRNVLVHKFVSPGTIEEKVDALLQQKGLLVESLIGGEDGAQKALTEMSNAELLDFVKLDIQSAIL